MRATSNRSDGSVWSNCPTPRRSIEFANTDDSQEDVA